MKPKPMERLERPTRSRLAQAFQQRVALALQEGNARMFRERLRRQLDFMSRQTAGAARQ